MPQENRDTAASITNLAHRETPLVTSYNEAGAGHITAGTYITGAGPVCIVKQC